MLAPRVEDRVVHRQVVQGGLLAGNDHVHVVTAAQAVVGDREERVCIGRQVDADDLGLLVDDVVDEARVLVREAVVVLAPDVRAEQVVERGQRLPPGDPACHLQPLRVLVEHRVDDVDEGLVAIEEPMPAGEQVPLEPALAEVLRKHLEHAALRSQVLVRWQELGLPDTARGLEDAREPVRVGLVGAEQAEGLRVARDHVAEEGAEDAGGFAQRRPRRRDLDRVVPEVGQDEIAQELAAVGVRVGAHPSVAAGRQLGELRHEPALLVEELVGPVAVKPVFEDLQVSGVVPRVGHRNLV